ncbi:hypothetical protein CB1_001226002 [Camelus ferus]|nr:hypothetical protein CB1_001226002 [Camelus ferus]
MSTLDQSYISLAMRLIEHLAQHCYAPVPSSQDSATPAPDPSTRPGAGYPGAQLLWARKAKGAGNGKHLQITAGGYNSSQLDLWWGSFSP